MTLSAGIDGEDMVIRILSMPASVSFASSPIIHEMFISISVSVGIMASYPIAAVKINERARASWLVKVNTMPVILPYGKRPAMMRSVGILPGAGADRAGTSNARR